MNGSTWKGRVVSTGNDRAEASVYACYERPCRESDPLRVMARWVARAIQVSPYVHWVDGLPLGRPAPTRQCEWAVGCSRPASIHLGIKAFPSFGFILCVPHGRDHEAVTLLWLALRPKVVAEIAQYGAAFPEDRIGRSKLGGYVEWSADGKIRASFVRMVLQSAYRSMQEREEMGSDQSVTRQYFPDLPLSC